MRQKSQTHSNPSLKKTQSQLIDTWEARVLSLIKEDNSVMKKYQKDSSSQIFLRSFLNRLSFFINQKIKGSSAGFTLIELLVVISVLGVLATGLIVLINPLGQIEKARDAGRKSDLRQIVGGLEDYYISNRRYPCFGGTNCGWAPITRDDMKSQLIPGYLKIIPLDPSGDWCNYLYAVNSNGISYTLYAILENTTDPLATSAKEAPNREPTGTNNSNITYDVTGGSCIGYTYNYWINS